MTTTAQQVAPTGRGDIAPKSMRVGPATRYTGIGRSKLYELMNAGRLRFTTIDRVRLILVEDLDKLVAPAG